MHSQLLCPGSNDYILFTILRLLVRYIITSLTFKYTLSRVKNPSIVKLSLHSINDPEHVSLFTSACIYYGTLGQRELLYSAPLNVQQVVLLIY